MVQPNSYYAQLIHKYHTMQASPGEPELRGAGQTEWGEGGVRQEEGQEAVVHKEVQQCDEEKGEDNLWFPSLIGFATSYVTSKGQSHMDL